MLQFPGFPGDRSSSYTEAVFDATGRHRQRRLALLVSANRVDPTARWDIVAQASVVLKLLPVPTEVLRPVKVSGNKIVVKSAQYRVDVQETQSFV